jgi:hypothetical protein
MAEAGQVSHRQRPGKRCERGGWQSSWSLVPRVCTPGADREGGEPRPTGPTGGKATPGRTAVGGNDRRDLERTHGLNATSTDGSAGTPPSGDAVHDAGAPDRRGPAAGGLSPDAPGWRAGSGRGHSGATVHVANGAGGLAPLVDLRFDPAAWPIHADVPADLADHWIAHLNAACSERGWQTSALGQLETDENSGTIVVSTGVVGQSPTLEIVWERPRGGSITVQARPAGTPAMTLDIANSFLDAVRSRCQAQTKVSLHRQAHLIYEGLPWRGELWLGQDLRLGPPSRHASWLIAPQVIIVDAEMEGIGWQGVNSTFALMLRELSIFLNVVVGIDVTVEKSGWAWTYKTDEAGKVSECDLRPLGYWETTSHSGMPQPGEVRPIPLRPVQRPGLEQSGIRAEDLEQAVPQDTVDLWQKYTDLPAAQRSHFLRAGNAYQIARSMWPDQRTAYAAFMVVACESLKPAGRRNDNGNISTVVEGLLDTSEAQQLRQLRLAPQRVRSQHLHRGELAGGELVPFLLQKDFGDPAFDDTVSTLTRTTRTCLIEWLRRGGRYTLKRPPERQTAGSGKGSRSGKLGSWAD